MERWIKIKGYEERYELSDMGRVRRIDGHIMRRQAKTD